MKKSKEKILQKALELFNINGFGNVSIRQIAAELNISHSNLIYHYKTKNDMADALHTELLQKAVALNASVKKSENFIEDLFNSTKTGFEILYDYRFFMIDLNEILKENAPLKSAFLEVEKVRSKMYKDVIEKGIIQGNFRKELYENEYDFFIEQIKIYSDSWITSSQIYHSGSTKKDVIDHYVGLFIKMFVPYFTEDIQTQFLKMF
ncbi:transcriptional regulator, TetR family [Paenimyroides aquimaris]|uniref:Transcriptional regulator, TetR family n=1 Tax=Paenimyroides marinum TaxID=1159016 RepID=A0A1H6MG50_9FLAO|nr:TetR/AcrR family transcriptional regulator [Paenimyroides aquimaris]SEI00575.1 transcriptional regulator, TetR family [Paenimyroides aquimaris]